jgi:hypothetical protein
LGYVILLINVYLSTVHAALGGFTPSQVAFGRNVSTPSMGPIEGAINIASSTVSYALKLKVTLDRVQNIITDLIREKKVKNLKLSNKKDLLSYKKGDIVGLKNEYLPVGINSKKLFPRFSGPHTIIKEAQGGKVLYLKDPTGKIRKLPVSIENVKPWPDRQTLLEEFDKYELIQKERKKVKKDKRERRVSFKNVADIVEPNKSHADDMDRDMDDSIEDIMGNPIDEDVGLLVLLPPTEKLVVLEDVFSSTKFLPQSKDEFIHCLSLDPTEVYKKKYVVRSTRERPKSEVVQYGSYNICYLDIQ